MCLVNAMEAIWSWYRWVLGGVRVSYVWVGMCMISRTPWSAPALGHLMRCFSMLWAVAGLSMPRAPGHGQTRLLSPSCCPSLCFRLSSFAHVLRNTFSTSPPCPQACVRHG